MQSLGSARLTYLTVAFVSFSGLLFELIQTRILSFIFWNHIVYLAISLALLGFGVSGTVASWLMRRTDKKRDYIIMNLTAAMSFSMSLSVIFLHLFLPIFRTFAPPLRLMFCYFISVPPFVFAGAVLSLIYASSNQPTGKIYRTDLIAAGSGCVLFFFLLPKLGAMAAVGLLGSMLSLIAFFWGIREGTRIKIAVALTGVVAVALFVIALGRPEWVEIEPESYKELAWMHQLGASTEVTRWTTLSRIDVTGSLNKRLVNYTEYPIGSYKVLTQDGAANTSLPGKIAIQSVYDRVRAGVPPHPAVVPYSILKQPDVAIIGVGGGIDVVDALSHDARSVLGIELNPFTYRVTKDLYADWNGGLLHDPRVTAINTEGRSAIRASKRKFDLIQVIAIDTFAALNSGAYVLSENYLYTVDAFRDYFAHLKSNGLLTLYRWNSTPPKETLRLTVLAAEAWRSQGVNRFDDRIMVVGDPQWAMTIFKNGSFTLEEVNAIAAVTTQLHETVFFWPKIMEQPKQMAFEQGYYQGVTAADLRIISRAFNDCMRAYSKGEQDQFFRSYPFKVTPTTDDSPFFFESSSLLSARNWSLGDLRGTGVQATLFEIVLLSTIIMACAILLPLWMYERQGLKIRGVGIYSTYFAGLGFGFMIIEISLMQKCVLLLGNPMYSVPVLLGAILLSAGFGSGFVPSWTANFKWKVRIACVLLLVSTGLAAAFLTFGAPALLQFSFAVRASCCAIIASPVGFFLGVFFPAGLQQLRDQAPPFVPWAWGINGCASVYGSVLAIVAAMWHGFNSVLLIGMAIYVAVMLSAQFIPAVIETSQLPSESEGFPLAVYER